MFIAWRWWRLRLRNARALGVVAARRHVTELLMFNTCKDENKIQDNQASQPRCLIVFAIAYGLPISRTDIVIYAMG